MPQQPPPIPPAPLSYARPATSKPSPKFHWGIFAWSELLMIAVCGVMIFVVPHFEDVFRDFKIEVPTSTRILLSAAWVVTCGGFVVLLATPVALGFISANIGPGGRRALRLLITVMMAAFILFIVVGLIQPMLTLMEGMSSSRK
jgi:type II secretory pathway component PulF